MRPSILDLVAIHIDADARTSPHAVDHLQVHAFGPGVALVDVDVGGDRRSRAGRIGARWAIRPSEDPAWGGDIR